MNTPADIFSDVWVLTNANGLTGTPRWIRLLPAGPGPSPRFYHSAVYEPGTNRLVVFGGRDVLPGGTMRGSSPTRTAWAASRPGSP